MLLSGAVAAVGGPLFGVLVARWVRFPGSALVAVVVLAGWVLAGTVALALPPSRVAGTLLHLSAPTKLGPSADGPRSPAWIAGGSPGWYLGYLLMLCGLAVTAALLPSTTGPRRGRLLRLLAAARGGCPGLSHARRAARSGTDPAVILKGSTGARSSARPPSAPRSYPLLRTALPAHGLPLTYARLALIALAGATAFVLDEPAAAAVAAVPVAPAPAAPPSG